VAISARLAAKTQLALARYCKARGITKTEALERGIKLLMQEEGMPHHSAYTAWLRLQGKFSDDLNKQESKPDSTSREQKDFLDAKYPG
jgi:hypothetical protein